MSDEWQKLSEEWGVMSNEKKKKKIKLPLIFSYEFWMCLVELKTKWIENGGEKINNVCLVRREKRREK